MSGIGISSAICKSAPHSRQITTPAPHHSVFLQAECPSCRPTNSVKSTGGFTLFTIAPKKTNSNCCTAALAVYLQLFNTSYYLHSPSTTGGTRVDMLRLAATASSDKGWISAQRQINMEKEWKHLLTQKVWALAVRLLAWHPSCRTSKPAVKGKGGILCSCDFSFRKSPAGSPEVQIATE